MTYQSSELYIIALQEAESGLKQWAPYHYIASLGDGMADADGWLKMTVQWWWFQTHCSEIRAHLKRVSPCPFLWWLVAQTAVTIWFSNPGSLSVSRTYVANALYNHLSHQVKVLKIPMDKQFHRGRFTVLHPTKRKQIHVWYSILWDQSTSQKGLSSPFPQTAVSKVYTRTSALSRVSPRAARSSTNELKHL